MTVCVKGRKAKCLCEREPGLNVKAGARLSVTGLSVTEIYQTLWRRKFCLELLIMFPWPWKQKAEEADSYSLMLVRKQTGEGPVCTVTFRGTPNCLTLFH